MEKIDKTRLVWILILIGFFFANLTLVVWMLLRH